MIRLDPIIPKKLFDGEHFIRFINALMEPAVRRMQTLLKTYPAYKYVSWASIGGFVSERQRRYVMANIAKGVITIPYPRTKGLQASWFLQIVRAGDALNYIVGTNHPKAKYVQSKPDQHKRMTIIGWATVEGVVKQNWPKEKRKIERAAKRYKPPA